MVINGQDVLYSLQDFKGLYEYADPTDPVEDEIKVWDNVLSVILSSPTFDGDIEASCEKALGVVNLRKQYKGRFNNRK